MMLRFRKQIRINTVRDKLLMEIYLIFAFQISMCQQNMEVIETRACSNPDTRNCNFFNINCGIGNRIQIIDAKYTLRTGKSMKSGHNKTCNSYSQPCETDSCCKLPPDSQTASEQYSEGHLYTLLQRCSWNQSCEKKAEFLNESSISCSVSYQCSSKANSANFCLLSNASANQVHLVFENTTQIKTKDYVVCRCTITSTGKYTIKAQDLRLQNAYDDCSETSTLKGFQADEGVNCSDGKYFQHANHFFQGLQYIDFELTIDPLNIPQMILIEATGDGKNTRLTANCSHASIIPSTTETSSRPSTQTSTVNSSSPSLGTEPSTVESTMLPPTSTTKTVIITTSVKTNQRHTSSRQPTVLDVNVDNSDDVPIAAIVVPLIVLLLAGAGFVIALWRKRCTRSLEKKYQNKDNADKVVHNPAYYKSPLKTSDNRMILESENSYTYIDHADNIQSKAVQAPENGHIKTARVNTDCFTEEHVNNLKNSNKLPSYNKIIDQNEETINHNYFILEPHLASNTVFCADSNTLHNLDVNEREEAQCPVYLELEPHDTYSSIDPEDVNVKTSADNEYNIINLKEKIITRDPNYGALNFGMNAKIMKDNCEYSHFQTMPEDRTNTNVSEYSQVQSYKGRHDTSDSQRNRNIFSSSASLAKTPMVNTKENNDYSHLKLK